MSLASRISDARWGGSRYYTNRANRVVLERHPGTRTTSRKRAVLLGNTASDHNFTSTRADARDWARVDDHATKNAISRANGGPATIADFGTWTTVRNGRTYRHQIIAGTHGTGPHLHYGVLLIIGTPPRKPTIDRRRAADRVISTAGVDLIARFEGFRGFAYNDAAGHATVGFGRLLHFGPVNANDRMIFGTKTKPKLTRREGLKLLRSDIRKKAANHVRRLVKVPVSQNEFDALVSLTFNIGPSAFASSTVLRQLNLNHRRRAGAAFLLFNKAGGKVLLGLSRRRRAERKLFRKGG